MGRESVIYNEEEKLEILFGDRDDGFYSPYFERRDMEKTTYTEQRPDSDEEQRDYRKFGKIRKLDF